MSFKVVKSIPAQQRLSRELHRQGKTIAVVPTMGYLHDGHLALIKRARKKADTVITTIFVNPAQFAPNEDFDRYPRDTRGDLRKIRETGGQVAFVPRREEIYPPGYQTYVEVEGLTERLEGRSRPTHFRGVTTIVSKLFNIVQPDFALFGMKDYQQAMVIKKLVVDLNWPLKIIVASTVREKDGLALSSRNKYLNDEQRGQAPALYLALKKARVMARDGIDSVAIIKRAMRQVIKTKAPDGVIDYIAATEMESLREISRVKRNTVISLAVKLGPVRLIDNMKVF